MRLPFLCPSMSLEEGMKLAMGIAKFPLKVLQVTVVLYEIYLFLYIDKDREDHVLPIKEDTLFSSKLNLLVEGLSTKAFEEIQSIMSSSYCVVVRKDSNFGIFNRVIENYGMNEEEVYFLVKKNRKYVVSQEIGQFYRNKGSIPPSYPYIFTSPWIDSDRFGDHHKYFFYTVTVKDYITNGIKLEIYKTLGFLNELEAFEIELGNGFYAKKTVSRKFSHIKISFDLIGTFECTIYNTENPTMAKLKKISENIGRIGSFKSICYFMTEITEQILALLFKMGVFKAKSRELLNLKAHPDLIPVIMPYVMVDCGPRFGEYAKLLTIGFDLRGVLTSEFGYLFDQQRVEHVVEDGGVYLYSRVVYV